MYLYKKILQRKVLAQDQSKVITKDYSLEIYNKLYLRNQTGYHEREVFMRKHSMLERSAGGRQLKEVN